MSALTHDKAEWMKLWMDTPIAPSPNSKDLRALKPGTCVKSKTLCGRIHQNDPEGACIVIGHGWNNNASEKFVWRGYHSEFEREWEID